MPSALGVSVASAHTRLQLRQRCLSLMSSRPRTRPTQRQPKRRPISVSVNRGPLTVAANASSRAARRQAPSVDANQQRRDTAV
jgi:hypothetical protein